MSRIQRLTRVLRSRVILDTEQGDRVIGHRCDLCDMRWKNIERHKADCILAGTEPVLIDKRRRFRLRGGVA
jgi:hypothetical protein